MRAGEHVTAQPLAAGGRKGLRIRAADDPSPPFTASPTRRRGSRCEYQRTATNRLTAGDGAAAFDATSS